MDIVSKHQFYQLCLNISLNFVFCCQWPWSVEQSGCPTEPYVLCTELAQKV